MPITMQTVNVNGTKKRENNPVRTGAQIGAAIGIGKLGIDTFRVSNRIYNATGNGLFKQLGLKLDEIATASKINSALSNVKSDGTLENMMKQSTLKFMINNTDDMLNKANTETLVAKAKELGINAEAIHTSKSAKFLYCAVLLGAFALINAGIGSLIGAGVGKIVEILNNKKEAEKQEIIKQVQTNLENK